MDKEIDGVAYVLNDEILSIGIVDMNCSILHCHKIKTGFICVLIMYIKNKCVSALVILGDPEENATLRKESTIPCLLATCSNIKIYRRQQSGF